MAYLSRGQSWEDIIRKQQEARDGELEQQRAAATRAMQQEARDGELEKQRAAATRALQAQVGGPRRFQNAAPSFFRRREYMPELEAEESPPPRYSYQQHIPFRIPSFSSSSSSSSSSPSDAGSNTQIRHLQKALTEKEARIQTLESDLGIEQDTRRCLQVERHDAVDAQRRVHDDEPRDWKAKVANLDQLLDDSIRRQRELEGELDTAREGSVELKRRLHEERCNHEAEIRARETREMRRLEETYCVLGDGMGREGGASRGVGLIEGEGQKSPARSRKQHKKKSGRAYVSIPKDGNRRAILTLS